MTTTINKIRLAVLAALALTALLLAGCVSVGEADSGSLPWSQPASWENTTLGIPM